MQQLPHGAIMATFEVVKRVLSATLALAMVFQAAIGCAFASQNVADACCAAKCANSPAPCSRQCCKVSPRSETAEVASSTVPRPPASDARVRAGANYTVAASRSLLPTVPCSRAAPFPAVFDQTCSLQI